MPGLIEARGSEAETAVLYLFCSSVSKSPSHSCALKLYFGLFINIHVRSFFWRVFRPARKLSKQVRFLGKRADRASSAWDTFLLPLQPVLWLVDTVEGEEMMSKRFVGVFFRVFPCKWLLVKPQRHN